MKGTDAFPSYRVAACIAGSISRHLLLVRVDRPQEEKASEAPVL